MSHNVCIKDLTNVHTVYSNIKISLIENKTLSGLELLVTNIGSYDTFRNKSTSLKVRKVTCWKTISGDNLMKLFERMPRVCKAVIKAKAGYFEES